MSSDPSDKILEERAAQAGDGTDGDPGEGAAKRAGRHARKASRSKPLRKSAAGRGESRPEEDDAGERLREHAAEVLAATRERIVEKPLQAVLVAAAAGAFVALLLGAGRR